MDKTNIKNKAKEAINTAKNQIIKYTTLTLGAIVVALTFDQAAADRKAELEMKGNLNGKTITYQEKKLNHIYHWPSKTRTYNKLTIDDKISKTEFTDYTGERKLSQKQYQQDIPEIITVYQKDKKYTLKLKDLFSQKEISSGLIYLEKISDPMLDNLRRDFINKKQLYLETRTNLKEGSNKMPETQKENYDIEKTPGINIRKEKIITNT